MAGEVLPIFSAPHLAEDERARLERRAEEASARPPGEVELERLLETCSNLLLALESFTASGSIRSDDLGQALIEDLAALIEAAPAQDALQTAYDRLYAWLVYNIDPPPDGGPRGPLAAQMALNKR